jgi:uncharacterized protein GlcG (DUF336 family)
MRKLAVLAVPLIADGALIGAIGCSGGTSAEDETS